MVVFDQEKKTTETISLNDLEHTFQLDDESMSGDQADAINMMLYVKDRFSVSRYAYQDMSKLCK